MISSLAVLFLSGVSLGWDTDTSSGTDKAITKQLDILAGAVQSIWSFDVTVELTTTLWLRAEKVGEKEFTKGTQLPIYEFRRLRPGEEPTVKKKYSRQFCERGRGRIERLSAKDGKATELIVYDENVKRTWIPAEGSATIRLPGIQSLGRGEDYRETFKTMEGRVELLRFLRRRQSLNVLNIEQIAGGAVIDGGAEPKPWQVEAVLPDWGIRAVLDVGYGMLPRIIETYEDVDGKRFVTRRLTVNQWKRLDKGVWVPILATTQVFSQQKPTFGELANEFVLKVDIEKSRWNVEFPDETFDLPLPVGTKVIDMTRKVEFVTGAPDPGKNLTDLAKHAQNVVEIRTDPIEPISRTWPTWIIWSSLAAFLICIFGAAYVWRRKRLGTP
jgi:hypothetical protein